LIVEQPNPLSNALLSGGDQYAVKMGKGDDTVRIGDRADIHGIIDCGSGFDTIAFVMIVPPDQFLDTRTEIEAANPAGGTITINGFTYIWENCDLLLDNIQTIQEIPTLSEWGLIAMAGVLGIVGFMVICRRKITA
jgi:hypothetical protein